MACMMPAGDRNMMNTRQQVVREEKPENLVTFLKQGNIDVRWRTARILGSMGSQSCDPLVKALYDDDNGVRLLAAWALGKTGEPRAIAALLRASPDDDNLVQLAIDCALERLLAGQHR